MFLRNTKIAGTVTCLLILVSAEARPENAVLQQNFDTLNRQEIPIAGSESDPGGAWKDFGKGESSPQITDQEFYKAEGVTSGSSVKITRNDALTETTDFWLTGAWVGPLEFGKLRISFRVLRDSPDSGFSVHMGSAEKFLGDNTIAVAIGNRSTSLEKLQVMKTDGKWQTTESLIHVGEWTKVTMDVDFEAGTYVVSINDLAVTEPIPFIKANGLRKISFLPTAPDGNVSFIDDVEIVELD